MTPERRASLMHKAGALALLGGVALAFALVIAAPIAQATIDARDEVAAARDRLAALQAKRVDLAALEAALKRETAKAVGQPNVIEAATSAVGWERLEAQLRSIASTRDVAVTSVRPLRLEDDGVLKALRLDVALQVPADRLNDLLAAIEAAAPALFVERLRVVRDASSADEDDRLETSLTLRALAAINPPPAAAPPSTKRQ